MVQILAGKIVAILATHGFDQSELLEPKKALEEAGAKTEVIALESGTIRGWKLRNWGQDVPVDVTIKTARAERYDALLLPGGILSVDALRTQPHVVNFVHALFEAGKPAAASGHGPWALVEADVLRGRRLTSWPSLRSDIRNAGGEWVDQDVVADRGLVTSRKASDLPAFNQRVLELFFQAAPKRIKVGATDVS
jgi:protease I